MPPATSEANTRRREKYKADRAGFIAELGGQCVDCGTDERLEFDHEYQRDWQPRDHARWVRLNKYRRDHDEGRTIVLRCRSCNARKGKPGDPPPSNERGFCGRPLPPSGVCICD